jgi:hypothetical protein
LIPIKAKSCLFGLLLFVPLWVWAESQQQTACDDLPRLPPLPSAEHWQQLRLDLAPRLPDCLHSAAFLSLHGAALVYTGDLTQGRELLERALLLEPGASATLVDYAQALFLSGDFHSALAINRSLLARDDVPAPLRAWLEGLQHHWQRQTSFWRGHLALAAGYHNNLNGVADLDSLWLTLPQGDLLLLLDEDASPVRGAYLTGHLAAEHYRTEAGGFRRWSISYQHRTTEHSWATTDEFSLGYDRRTELDTGLLSWSGEASYFRYGGEQLYAALGGDVTFRWRGQGCQPFIESSWRALHFPEAHYLDELDLMAGGGLSCKRNGSVLEFGLYGGSNLALSDRPGDDRNTAEARMSWDYQQGEGYWRLQYRYAYTADDEGYSRLLDHNAARKLSVQEVSVRYIHRLDADFFIHVGYYWRDQDSSLDLFETNSMNADIGISVVF